MKIGSFVTFKIAGINGPFKVAGIVKRTLPAGVEVKTQANGYHVVAAESLTVVGQPREKCPCGCNYPDHFREVR